MFESYENPSVKSSDSNAASSKLSAQIFSDPKDFLSTLQSSFKQLSHGHDQLTAADLKLDAADPTLDAKTRAAAQIGFDHFKDFAGLSYQGEPAAHNTPKQNDAITSGDLSFAQDMNNHDTLSYKLENIARDTAVGVMGAAAGAFGGLVGTYELSTGIGLFGGAGTAIGALAVGWVAVGAGGVGLMGYAGYKAVTENSRMNNVADKDSAMFKSWLDKP